MIEDSAVCRYCGMVSVHRDVPNAFPTLAVSGIICICGCYIMQYHSGPTPSPRTDNSTSGSGKPCVPA